MKWLPILLVAAILPLGYLFDRLLLWMEDRGWIFYRMSRPDSKNVGPAVLEIEALFQPSKRHVLEQKIEQRAQEDDDGGPDKAGRPGKEDKE